ncbi:helix-turn-helix domain-containing protein, partial [Kineococcus indalonis]|uniref:helix-turn-helix domain-containing protein n=1 Tax=Kineococcus indalonis TaxID=2696566 RepID=UPI001411BC71
MSTRDDVRDFLTSRRARLTPEQADLSTPRGYRRVPGLRRGEVADLAGVSVEYYARLERGNLCGASPEVLGAVARALQLDEVEHAHLLDLARAAGPAARSHRRTGRA